jgi:hypothetical protein
METSWSVPVPEILQGLAGKYLLPSMSEGWTRRLVIEASFEVTAVG